VVHATARRALALVAVVAVVALVVAAPGAPAGAVDVDPTYAPTGLATNVALRGAAVQPDGKLVVVGEVSLALDSSDWFTARFTTSGQLDPSYGDSGTGIRTFNLTGVGVRESAQDVAIAPDGKIVVVGYSADPESWVVLRLHPNGTPDPTYAGDGGDYVFIGNTADARPQAVAVQPDGKIVVVGATAQQVGGVTTGIRATVARLDVDGTVDEPFTGDGDGVFIGGFTAAGETSGATSVAIQPDGRIVVAGRSFASIQPDFGFLRFTTDGALDSSFDGDGRAIADFGAVDAGALAVGVLSDGRIVGVGDVGSNLPRQLGVALLTPSGGRDPSFDGDGLVVHALTGQFVGASDLVIQTGDRIVAAGYTGTAQAFDVVLARLTTAGALDPSFSDDGIVVRDLDGPDDRPDVAPRADGSLLVVAGSKAARVFGFLPGYWMASAEGEVYPFGVAQDLGDVVGALAGTGARLVKLEPTPSRSGYYLLDTRGQVHAFGDAVDRGDVDLGVLAPGEVVSSLSVTPDNGGYWVFTSRGRAITFGNAVHLGDMSAVALNGPVLGSIPTPSGAGYYMVASDGGIFSFGDAVFRGSMGGQRLNQPVQGLVPTADNGGYWLVASDGGIFAFGNAGFRGSMGATPLNKPVVGMVRYGNGYLMVASDGGIFSFSDLDFVGSLGANPPASPIATAAAVN
jgi:uncharacterized delta-60 repeat protein